MYEIHHVTYVYPIRTDRLIRLNCTGSDYVMNLEKRFKVKIDESWTGVMHISIDSDINTIKFREDMWAWMKKIGVW